MSVSTIGTNTVVFIYQIIVLFLVAIIADARQLRNKVGPPDVEYEQNQTYNECTGVVYLDFLPEQL